MRQTKYIMSGGLAFSEDKDMEKLRRYSLKGWHVSDFKLMGYTLEKGESSDYIYSVDYRSLKENEMMNTLTFFQPQDGRMLPQQEIYIYFEQNPIQNRFIVIETQLLKSMKVQLVQSIIL